MSSSQRHFSVYLLVLLGLGFGTLPCFPQATTGSITGRVSDASGAVIPDAAVSASNPDTAITCRTQSNAAGEYFLGGLPPGRYTVMATKEGFKAVASEVLTLSIDQKMRFDFVLSIATAVTKLEVIARAPLLQTQEASAGQVIDSKQILNLPLLGRNFLDLALLTTGVAPGTRGSIDNVNYTINGQREYGNSVVVDGTVVNSNRQNDTLVRPSVDAVQEFKVVTSNSAPEFGRAAGGVIVEETKSGTNAFHGSVYEFLRNPATTARTFFEQTHSQLRQNNFGGTLGGPIQKQKTFFFTSYEGQYQHDTNNYFASVPPAGQIKFLPDGSADLSHLVDPWTGKQTPIYDPKFYTENWYSQQFPGNIIPADRVSPAGRAVIEKLFPVPNRAGDSFGYTDNFAVSDPVRLHQQWVDLRLDHNFNEKNRISGIYHIHRYTMTIDDPYRNAVPIKNGGSTDTATAQYGTSQSFSIPWTYTISNHALNEVRVGYYNFGYTQVSPLHGTDIASVLGFGNINVPQFPATYSLPFVQLGGIGASTGGSSWMPLVFRDSNWQVGEAFSYLVGHHQFKVGGDYRHLSSRPLFNLTPTGYQWYAGAWITMTGDPNYSLVDYSSFYGNGGSDIADLLLGLPYQTQIGLQLTQPHTMSWETSFFAQDTWQVTSNLTLNYGLRYDYSNPWYEADNNASNFDFQTKAILIAGRGGNSRSLINPDRKNFGPRFGFAYRFRKHTVVRGAYGIFYTPETDARNDIPELNYPYNVQQLFFDNIYGGAWPLSYQIDSGQPRTTSIPLPAGAASIPAAQIMNPSVQTLQSVNPHFPIGYVQSYNLTLQRELAAGMSLELGYVGSVSHHLGYLIGNVNFNKGISPNLGTISYLDSVGNASYNSLQAKVSKQYANHLWFLISYTYSKALDNGPAPLNLGAGGNYPQDPFNLSAEWGPSPIDSQHRLVGSFIYDLPIGAHRSVLGNAHGVTQAVFGDWQLNGIISYQSGLPFNILRASSLNGLGLRPNLVGNPIPAGFQQNVEHWFDKSAFSTAGLTKNTKPGSLGRNVLRGPSFNETDISLFKNFSLREDIRLQARFEAFNLFNHPNFANPVSNMASANFSEITGIVGIPRIFQFGLKLVF
ncbi:MAG: carboxypeptidase regulatory-like domain-containing protein [Terriglobia bacterium]